MLAVKARLVLQPADPAGSSPRGGFLLGSSPEQYAFFIRHASVFVLEDVAENQIAGFAVTLPDEVLRATGLWARRRLIEWRAGAWDEIERGRVGYFEQLAVLPERRYKIYAPALALAALKALLDTGHEHLFATVVREPVHNRASLRMLEAIGAHRVGQIDESYEEAGQILSDVYYLHAANQILRDGLSGSSLGKRIAHSSNRLSPVTAER